MRVCVATIALGAVQRLVGRPHQRLRLVFALDLVEPGNAGADRHEVARAGVMFNRQADHGCANAFGNACRSFLVGVGQKRGEFLAAVARRQVTRPSQCRQQNGGDFAQAIVTCEMTVAVVERLEPIDVDHDQREILFLAFGLAVLAHQGVVEGAAVGESGQAILTSQRPQPPVGVGGRFFMSLSRRDVAQRSDDA